MPVSKNRRKNPRKEMRPRTFKTVKAARKYLRRFKARFFYLHRGDEALEKTMVDAIRMSKKDRAQRLEVA